MVAWLNLYITDVVAVLWLFSCWVGYSVFAHLRARKVFCIASVLHVYRYRWMLSMLFRDNRIADASLLSSLERNASFLASTAILIIAGLVTTLASIETVHATLATMPFAQASQTSMQLQYKIILLLLIFVYSFFTFTWAMRQYGFCAIMLGGAPNFDKITPAAEEYAASAAKVFDQAGLSYNVGLRGYYFSLSVLAWIFNLWTFIVAVALVVVILYLREFHSSALLAMIGPATENRASGEGQTPERKFLQTPGRRKIYTGEN
jgi:uncharacterized membrane protein